VGNPHGQILFGLIISFEPELLEAYGAALDFLYKSGLEVFYVDDIDDLLLEFIEGVLLGDCRLKKV